MKCFPIKGYQIEFFDRVVLFEFVAYILPISAPPEVNDDSFDLDDSEDVIGLVRTMVDGSYLGILSTIDKDGRPRLRWMATLSFEDFPLFHTLTSPDSGKVAEIKRHPDVCWMFSNHDKSMIINLTGKARVLEDTKTLKRIWKHIEDKSHAYFLKHYTTGAGFVVIETTVEMIECTSPKNALKFTLPVTALPHSR